MARRSSKIQTTLYSRSHTDDTQSFMDEPNLLMVPIDGRFPRSPVRGSAPLLNAARALISSKPVSRGALKKASRAETTVCASLSTKSLSRQDYCADPSEQATPTAEAQSSILRAQLLASCS